MTYLRATDGSPPIRLGEGFGEALSPDGKWALAAAAERRSWILWPTASGSARTLAADGFVRVDNGGWLADGRIVFSAFDAMGRRRLYLQDIKGGMPRPISQEGVTLAMKAGTPDGRFAVGRTGDGYFLFPVEGGPPQRLSLLADDRHAASMERRRPFSLRSPRPHSCRDLSPRDCNPPRVALEDPAASRPRRHRTH